MKSRESGLDRKTVEYFSELIVYILDCFMSEYDFNITDENYIDIHDYILSDVCGKYINKFIDNGNYRICISYFAIIIKNRIIGTYNKQQKIEYEIRQIN